MLKEACYTKKCAITCHNGMLGNVIYCVVIVLCNCDVTDLIKALHNMT